MSNAAGDTAAATVADRFAETDLEGSRFVDVADGEKACYDHDTRYDDAAAVPGQNYGIYTDGDDGLVVLDVDDHREDKSKVGVQALFALPATLEAGTPHGGTHKVYEVDLSDSDADTVADLLADRLGVKNPTPTWGEVQAANKYVVGAGSQLTGCSKDWCDECATDDGGRYTIKQNQAIATVAAGDLVDVLAADPDVGREQPGSADETPTPDGVKTGFKDTAFGGTDEFDEWIDEDTAEELLDAADPDIDYNQWRNVGFALVELFDRSTAKRLFVNWSKGGSKWDSDAAEHADRIIDDASSGGGDVSPATLVHHAQQGGWQRSARSNGHSDGEINAKQNGHNDDEVDVELYPAAVAAEAGLGEGETVADLNDRQKAAAVWTLIRKSDDVHVCVRRDNAEIWGFDDERGVWNSKGERLLRHAAVRALTRQHYGSNVLAELKAQARADINAEVEADEFGVDPGTVAVANGLLDLNAAAAGDDDALRELRPEDYALVRLPVEYDPEAEFDEWGGYVDEWAERGRADALQEFVGYCLQVGDMPIHRALLLVGSGANGKGTFLHVVRNLLGSENTSSAELQTLANEKDAVADLYGDIANIDDDLSSRGLGSGLGMFKKLVGGDRVRARRLYEEGFEFDATAKHLYAANQVPDVNVGDEDEAFWRRWLLVEFPNHYPPSERDPGLRDRLTTDDALSGVLNWAIEGRRRLLENGKFTGEEEFAHKKRQRWQQWGDTVDEFIEDCVERNPDAPRRTTNDVFQVYRVWLEEQDESDDTGQRQLTNQLKNEHVGYGKHRIAGSVQRGYTALGFTDDAPDVDEVFSSSGSDDDGSGGGGNNAAIAEFDDTSEQDGSQDGDSDDEPPTDEDIDDEQDTSSGSSDDGSRADPKPARKNAVCDELEGFDDGDEFTAGKIAGRLGLSPQQAADVLEHLTAGGTVERLDDDSYRYVAGG